MNGTKLYQKRIDSFRAFYPWQTRQHFCRHLITRKQTYTMSFEIDTICCTCGALVGSQDVE